MKKKNRPDMNRADIELRALISETRKRLELIEGRRLRLDGAERLDMRKRKSWALPAR
jgi:hypothetical protein